MSSKICLGNVQKHKNSKFMTSTKVYNYTNLEKKTTKFQVYIKQRFHSFVDKLSLINGLILVMLK